MKTLNLHLTLFALAIQVMVSAQTNNNSKKINDIEFSKNLQLLPTLGTKKVKTIQKNIQVKQVKSFAINVAAIAELEYQANEFTQIANELKSVATNLVGIKKNQAINEMKDALILSYIYQIKLSESIYETRKAAFNENKAMIEAQLANKNNFQKALLDKITYLVNSSNADFKTAKEIRQEAYAMPTIGGTAGALANAEEKENSAIEKQLQSLNLIFEAQPNTTNSSSLMVIKL